MIAKIHIERKSICNLCCKFKIQRTRIGKFMENRQIENINKIRHEVIKFLMKPRELKMVQVEGEPLI